MQTNLSMRDIDTTLVLGRTLNFRQAAAQLHLSQSALSTQIQRIEDALGVRLFDRTTRTVRLTAAGEVFMQQAAALQAAFRDAIAAVSGIVNAEQGQVSVAALPSIAARLLPRVLMAYRQAHPLVALKVRDTLSGPAFDLVRAGEVDFALTAADPQHAESADWTARCLGLQTAGRGARRKTALSLSRRSVSTSNTCMGSSGGPTSKVSRAS